MLNYLTLSHLHPCAVLLNHMHKPRHSQLSKDNSPCEQMYTKSNVAELLCHTQNCIQAFTRRLN